MRRVLAWPPCLWKRNSVAGWRIRPKGCPATESTEHWVIPKTCLRLFSKMQQKLPIDLGRNCISSSVQFSSVAQSCPTPCSIACLLPALWDPMDYKPPGSSFVGFSRQEYWSGFPFPPPRDLRHPGIEPQSPSREGRFFTTEPPGKPQRSTLKYCKWIKHASLVSLCERIMTNCS